MSGVDVLAVLDALNGNTSNLRLDADVKRARAAVAELIEAVSDLSEFATRSDWHDRSTECADETSRLWSRVDSALARVSGGAA